MKKEEIDRLITESLSKDEAEFYKQFDEENIFKKWINVYKGKDGWLAVLLTILNILFVIIAIYFAYHVINEESVLELLRYSVGFFFSMIIIAMLEIWIWMEIQKNAVLREIKRLEFQVAVLMEKTEASGHKKV